MNTGEQIMGFERAIDSECRQIPMVVRMKLDLCGLRMGLGAWQRLSDADKASLIEAQVDDQAAPDGFRALLEQLCGKEALSPLSPEHLDARAAWLTGDVTPPQVTAAMAKQEIDLDWARLEVFPRYVLNHLASREAWEKFSSAVLEFAADRPG